MREVVDRNPDARIAEFRDGAVGDLTGARTRGLSQLEYVALQRWQEVATILVGLWLIVSPLVLGYSGEGFLRIYHTSLGAVAVILGVLQLWQDWDLSDQDMLKHGQ